MLNLRHPVEILQEQTIQDKAGAEERFHWSTYAKRTAEIKSNAGREYFEDAQEQSEISHAVMVRYCSKTKAITPDMRIRFNGNVLDIDAAINFREESRYMLILCKKQSSQQTNDY